MTSFATVSSPCIRRCTLNDEDVCCGCFRHVEEIMVWGCADDDAKRAILQAAEQRRQAATGAR